MTRTEYNKSINKSKLVIEINKDLRKSFKKICTLNDTTMKAELKKFIEKFVSENV